MAKKQLDAEPYDPLAEDEAEGAEKVDLSIWDDTLTLEQKLYLDCYSKCGNHLRASIKIGFKGTHKHYGWLRRKGREGEIYGAEFRKAEEFFGDRLEGYARDRAFAGDTTMTIFLLKGHKPDKYGDRIRIQRQLEGMSEDDLDKIIGGGGGVGEPSPDPAG